MSAQTATPAAPRASVVPDWCVVGAEVAVLRDDWKRHHHAPVYRRILRIGKRDLVLEDLQRFSFARGLARDEGGLYGWTVKVMPFMDPVVVEAQAHADHHELVVHARAMCDDYLNRRDAESLGRPPVEGDVILALAPLTGVGYQITSLFNHTEKDDSQ